MSKRQRTVHDPDLGVITIPDRAPNSKREWNAMRARIRQQLLRASFYRPGERYACPECGRRAMTKADDLTSELVRGESVVVFSNLAGARCRHCHAEALEAREVLRLDDAAEGLAREDEEARVTRIGKGTLGTYWPKNVERHLGLRPGDRIIVRLLTPSSAMMRVERAPKRAGGPSSTARRAGRRTRDAR